MCNHSSAGAQQRSTHRVETPSNTKGAKRHRTGRTPELWAKAVMGRASAGRRTVGELNIGAMVQSSIMRLRWRSMMEKTAKNNESNGGPEDAVPSDLEKQLHCSTHDRSQMAGKW